MSVIISADYYQPTDKSVFLSVIIIGHNYDTGLKLETVCTL